jgi:molybdopterin-guanine dinucleotide biosynthesis protein A
MRSQPHAQVHFDDVGAFVNLNTLADLASAERSTDQAA